MARAEENRSIFAGSGLSEYFEESLLDLADRHQWQLFAYTVLPSSFHIVCKTKDPDLPAGMKWLMGNVAANHNRTKKRYGHVFSGRYKSLLVEDAGDALLPLIHFVHAAPVRKGLKKIDELHTYPGNSFGPLWRGTHPDCLARQRLIEMAGVPDNRSAMKQYRAQLAASREADPRREAELQKRFCRGWFIGSPNVKLRYARKLAGIDPKAIYAGPDHREVNELMWENLLQKELARLKKTSQHILHDQKGAAWKAEIAFLLRAKTSADNAWIADRLNMGHPNRVCMVLRPMREKAKSHGRH